MDWPVWKRWFDLEKKGFCLLGCGLACCYRLWGFGKDFVLLSSFVVGFERPQGGVAGITPEEHNFSNACLSRPHSYHVSEMNPDMLARFAHLKSMCPVDVAFNHGSLLPLDLVGSMTFSA
jgi:hypothetical protein